jgi:hypothetical protein
MVRRTVRRKPDPEIRTMLPDDYSLETGEIDNITYLTFKYGAGLPGVRAADVQMVMLLRDKNLKGEAAVRNTVRAACEYVWDHFLDEPKRPTPATLYRKVAPVLTLWYGKTTPAQRRSTK